VATATTTKGIAMRYMAAARVRGKLPNQMPVATRALRLGCLSTAGPRIKPDQPEEAGCYVRRSAAPNWRRGGEIGNSDR